MKIHRNKSLAKLLYGNTGGQARALAAQAVENAMKSLHTAAVASLGEEEAAALMWKLVRQDPDQVVCPDWLRDEFTKHREFILEETPAPENKLDALRRGHKNAPRKGE